MSKEAWKKYVTFMVDKGNIDQLMIVDSKDATIWATSSENDFYLREYKTNITQEDGTEKEELVNESNNLIDIVINNKKSLQGLRINKIKLTIAKNFKDEETNLTILYAKSAQAGACITNAGKCILIAFYSEAKKHIPSACNEMLRLMAIYLYKSVWPIDEKSNSNANAIPSIQSSGSANSSGLQTQLDSLVLSKDVVATAGIIAKETGKILAMSSNFKLDNYDTEIPQEDGSDKLESVDECKNILELMNHRRKPSQGLRIQQTKYQILQMFEESASGCYTVYGKKTTGGCCLAITNTAIIIATFELQLDQSAPSCNGAICNLAKTIKDSGL
eukprot:gene21873-28315_t